MPNAAPLNYVLACQTEALLSFDLLKPCFVHEITGHEFIEIFRMVCLVSFFVPGVRLGVFFGVSGPFLSPGAWSNYLLLFLLCIPYPPNLHVSFLLL